jgi:hypothetical protein
MAMRNDHHDIAQLLESRMVFVSTQDVACHSMTHFFFPAALFAFILIQIAHIFTVGTSKQIVALALKQQQKSFPTVQCVLLCTALHKGKVMKVYRGIRGTAPLILNHGTRWRRVVRFTPQPLFLQGKNPCYPLSRRLGGHESLFGHFGEERNLLSVPGVEPCIAHINLNSIQPDSTRILR